MAIARSPHPTGAVNLLNGRQMEELEMQLLKGQMSEQEATAAASRLAQETDGLSAQEKIAFARGVRLACSGAVATGNLDAVTARIMTALLIAAFDLQQEQNQRN